MAERHRIIVVREGDEQAFEGEALPVSIGSSDTDDVRVAMGPAAGAVASIGFLEGQAFIQSARSSAEVLISGDRLVDSSWLRDGDVIQVGAASIACTFRGGALRLEVGPYFFVEADFRAGRGIDSTPIDTAYEQITVGIGVRF